MPDMTDHMARHPLQLLLVLLRERKTILQWTGVAALAAVIVVLLLPNQYTATARIMPPERASIPAAIFSGSQTGALSSLGLGLAGLKNPSDLYVSVLQAQTIADKLISRFQLREEYRTKTIEDTRLELKDRSVIKAGPEGIISVSVEDRDRKRAADMANEYIAELRQVLRDAAHTEATQRFEYYGGQLKEAQEALATAEQEFKQMQKQTGVLHPQAQSEALIKEVGGLEAQILLAEANLNRIGMWSAPGNPEYQQAAAYLNSLRQQLNALQARAKFKGGLLLGTTDVPESGIQFLRSYRNLKYRELIFETLAKQLEIARLESSKTPVTIEMLDVAKPPEKKSWPPRAIIVLAVTFVVFVIACARSMFHDAIRNRLSHDPEQAVTIEMLAEELLAVPGLRRLMRPRSYQEQEH
jgi:tyrosine-protein kinase Etk/Wzc